MAAVLAMIAVIGFIVTVVGVFLLTGSLLWAIFYAYGAALVLASVVVMSRSTCIWFNDWRRKSAEIGQQKEA